MAELPELEALASDHYSFRELCECSDTWRRLRPANRPRELATYHALQALCCEILEPVRAEFGAPHLTYGFAGPELTRSIGARIAPRLDQHAGHERNTRGAFICPRLGQAVDFKVTGVRTWAVAAFIAAELPFDRLYVYGDDQPLHVSFGPQQTRSLHFVDRRRDRPIPRRISLSDLQSGRSL